MAEAKVDNNRITTILGTSNLNGETPLNPLANPSTHVLQTDDASTGSDLSDDIASRDNNMNTVILGVSETDGVTPVAIYVNSSGQLLIDSS